MRSSYHQLLCEVGQAHSIRKPLYKKLEQALGSKKKVVAFFTSFTFPVLINDQDADMLEEVLRSSDMQGKELVLLLNSPGGDALSAERIVNICHSFSANGYSTIVPKMAKSAATMICLGAEKIGVSKTSELGPIDPQFLTYNDQGRATGYKAAHEILESYNDLIEKANKSRGRIEPFLQQLQRFDARDIRSIYSARELSESIAISCLKRGMCKALSNKQIKSKIGPFLNPKYTKAHGRPIYYDVARTCGLDVELYENGDPTWAVIWELYVRLNHFVSTVVSKAIETAEESWTARHIEESE